MTSLLDELTVSGHLKALVDLRRLSYRERISGIACSVTGTPSWARTRRGSGINSSTPASISGLSMGNPAGLQLNTLTLFAYAQHDRVDPVQYHGIFGKLNAYHLLLNPTTQNFVVWDPTAGSYRTSGHAPTRGVPHLYVASIVNGLANGLQMYVDGLWKAQSQVTVLNHAASWVIGNFGINGYDLQGSVLTAGIVDYVLSPAEIARLHVDFLNECIIPAPPRNFYYRYPSMDASMYAAKRVVLDSDLERIATSTVRDLTLGYPGTVTGVPVPGTSCPNNEGLSLAYLDWINHGDVTQLNSTSAFSVEVVVSLPPGTIINSYILSKYLNANNNIFLGVTTGGTISPKKLVVSVCSGGASSVATNDQVIRAGTTQHILVTYNAGSVIVYVDGTSCAHTATGVIPATTANLAGTSYYDGVNGGPTTPMTLRCHRLWNRALSPVEARAEYLEWARRITLQIPGEHLPVTLGASTTELTPWQSFSGTWKVSEDSTGKRWLQCVTAGCALTPRTIAFGTDRFTFVKATPGAALYVTLHASIRDTLTGSQNGYVFASDAGERVGLYVSPSFTAKFYSATNYIVTGTAYTVTISRRPSDGRFTGYIKGGVYVTDTLISPIGGAGSNPSTAESTYTTSNWMLFVAAAGDKLLIYDPSDPGAP